MPKTKQREKKLKKVHQKDKIFLFHVAIAGAGFKASYDLDSSLVFRGRLLGDCLEQVHVWVSTQHNYPVVELKLGEGTREKFLVDLLRKTIDDCSVITDPYIGGDNVLTDIHNTSLMKKAEINRFLQQLVNTKFR